MTQRRRDNAAPWRAVRPIAFPILWGSILAFLFFVREVLAPFFGAVLIAFLLAPLVRKIHSCQFKRVSIPRWAATLSIYFILAALVGLYSWLAVPKVAHEFSKLAQGGERFFHSLTPEKLDEFTIDVRTWLEDSGLPVRIVSPHLPDEPQTQVSGFVLNIDEAVRATAADFSGWLRENFFAFLKLGPKFAVNLFRMLLMTFLVLMVAAFLLVDPGRLINFFRRLFPPRLHVGFDEVLHEMERGMAGVVRGQVIICLINGLLTFVGMLILGIKFPVLLSTLAAVFSLIPIFGSILSSIPIVAVGLTAGFAPGLGILLWIVGIHLLEANFLNPKIIGDQARIHPALVVLVLLSGEHLYGILGALFAVPILSVALALFRVLHQRACAWSQETCAVPEEGPTGAAQKSATSSATPGSAQS